MTVKSKNRKIEKNHQIWKIDIKKKLFSKSIYGAQKGNKVTNIKTNLNKNIIYLDMDFSVSESGYNRGPHRDRDFSRILNFLVYLNTLDKKDGGKLFLILKIKEILNILDFQKKKIFLYQPQYLLKKELLFFFPQPQTHIML